jgi:hypothetical protein
MKERQMRVSGQGAALTGLVSRIASFSAVLAVLVALVALTGCTQFPSTGFGPDIPVRRAADTKDLIVGTPENSSRVVTISNRTGQTVNTVAFKLSTEEAFGSSFISQEWREAQSLKIYFTERQGALLEEGMLFDIRLTLADGVSYTIADVDLLKSSIVDLRIDARTGLAYLGSVSALGQPVSTLEQSIATKNAEEEAARLAEAQAQADAEARAEAEAAAAAEAEAAAASSAEGDYGYSYDTGGTSGGSGGVSQSGDACVDDIILR